MRRWRINVAVISGRVTITVAAMIWPQGCWKELPDFPTKVVIASGTV